MGRTGLEERGQYLHAFAQALEIPIVQPLPTCIETLDDLAALQAAGAHAEPSQVAVEVVVDRQGVS